MNFLIVTFSYICSCSSYFFVPHLFLFIFAPLLLLRSTNYEGLEVVVDVKILSVTACTIWQPRTSFFPRKPSEHVACCNVGKIQMWCILHTLRSHSIFSVRVA